MIGLPSLTLQEAAGLLRRAYARHVVDKGEKEGAPTYVDMMRWNVGRIIEALQ